MNKNLHPVKAEILRKNESIRNYLGESGGPRPGDDEAWAEMYAEFERIKEDVPKYQSEPPTSVYDDSDSSIYNDVNNWYYKQLLGTSRGTIEKNREKKLIEVYPGWVQFARDKIRDKIVTAPPSFNEGRFEEDRCECGGCGETHEWFEVVEMKCSGCDTSYCNKPDCINLSMEDARRLMNGTAGQDSWKCGDCAE